MPIDDNVIRENIVIQYRRLFIHDGRDIEDSDIHLHLKHLKELNFGLVDRDSTCRLCCWSFQKTEAEDVVKLVDKANELSVGPLYIDRSADNLRVWRFVTPDSSYTEIRDSAQE